MKLTLSKKLSCLSLKNNKAVREERQVHPLLPWLFFFNLLRAGRHYLCVLFSMELGFLSLSVWTSSVRYFVHGRLKRFSCAGNEIDTFFFFWIMTFCLLFCGICDSRRPCNGGSFERSCSLKTQCLQMLSFRHKICCFLVHILCLFAHGKDRSVVLIQS